MVFVWRRLRCPKTSHDACERTPARDRRRSSRSLLVHQFLLLVVVVVTARLIGFAFSDDIKSGNGLPNCRHRAAARRIVAKTLSLISTVCHVVAGTRPRPARVLPSSHAFVLVVVRDLEPHLGKNRPIVRIFLSFPVCRTTRPYLVQCVRRAGEQSEPSTISRVISESNYIPDMSPYLTSSTRTMIARRIPMPAVNQSEMTAAAQQRTNAATNVVTRAHCQHLMRICRSTYSLSNIQFHICNAKRVTSNE